MTSLSQDVSYIFVCCMMFTGAESRLFFTLHYKKTCHKNEFKVDRPWRDVTKKNLNMDAKIEY
ncbi:hypothetical protein DesLBE_1862 [Desulfitobacterium sp. LBE]|nr:hypothetical protein DesLBE_1862 [Desulfitobacterium sp. LBE]